MADYKAFSPSSWKAFMKMFPEKSALVVTALPAASADMTNLVRFSLETGKWYVCDGTAWQEVGYDIDLSHYAKNLVTDKKDSITAGDIAEYDTFDTSDEAGEGTMVFGEVAEGDHNPVDGDTVYNALSSSIVAETLTVNIPAGTDGNGITIGKSGYKPISATVVSVAYVVPCYCFLEGDERLTVKAQSTVSSATNILVRVVWQKQ